MTRQTFFKNAIAKRDLGHHLLECIPSARFGLEGLRSEQSVSELCRREGIASNLYYRWSKDFLKAGKKQLAGDTIREATSDEVKDLRAENRELKEVVAEVTLKNRVLKKSLTGHGEEDDT
jgi:transposase